MKHADILIIGGDKRQTCLYRRLAEHGHRVSTFLVPGIPSDVDMTSRAGIEAAAGILAEYIGKSKYIICPVPFSRDGINITTSAEYAEAKLPVKLLISLANERHTIIGGSLSPDICALLTKNDIPYHDLMTFDSLVCANACLTAEGLLKYIIETVPFSIAGSRILVLGYGKCGSAIANLLRLLGGSVDIYNRNRRLECKAAALGFKSMPVLPADSSLSEYDIIINTIPDKVYTKEHLIFTKNSACLFEVASAPGGFDMEYVRANGINYRNCPGIPGKLSPLSAAEIICHVLENEL